MHFIGHLQSNKVNQVLRWATCVQTVDTARLAQRLDAAVARGVAGWTGRPASRRTPSRTTAEPPPSTSWSR
ncbi:hypothetical protein [Georgenia sp. SUBG003]|uniref:hypothetical protein n=1 Tax=Georgenia sp. SUBG003 TaxID=1497974 RepID=UPI000ABD71CE